MARAKESTRSVEVEETSLDPDLPNPNLVSLKENGELEIKDVSPTLKPRAYQEEMLAESFRQNIIITVGSPWFASKLCQSASLTVLYTSDGHGKRKNTDVSCLSFAATVYVEPSRPWIMLQFI